MDGPISTSEPAGPAQQAACIPFRRPSVGPPEKVPPVSEGNRPRSAGRDEAGLHGEVSRNPEPQDRKAEMGGPANGKERGRPLPADRGSAGTRSEIKKPFKLETDKDRETLPLTGDSSTPALRKPLAEALAAAKARWAEVNQEALEADILPGQPVADSSSDPAAPAEGRDITDTRRTSSTADMGFSSEALDPTAPSGKDSSEVERSNGLHRRLTIRYENLATSLSNPHPTRPVIDLLV
jgi:hypothetical protein